MEESPNDQNINRLERIENWVLNHPIGFMLAVFSSILFMLILYWAIWSDVSPEWTGFGKYITPNGEFIRHKTLWDWMELLIVPVALAIGAFWLNSSQKRTELEVAAQQRKQDRQIATDRQQQATLETYYDRLTDLLLNHQLRNKDAYDDEERSIATARTLAVLRTLDGERKGQVLKFLIDSGLVGRNNKDIISLTNSDLRGANLRDAQLSGVTLWGADLRAADLQNAGLSGTSLIGASLEGTNLKGAYLVGTRLNETTQIDDKWRFVWEIVNSKRKFLDLKESDLRGANLSGVILKGLDLSGSDLRNSDLGLTDLTNTNLSKANLRNAILSGALLTGANLCGADFRGADLRYVHFKDVLVDDLTYFDSKWQLVFELNNQDGVNKNLAGVDLRRADLKGVSLKGANLKNADLSHSDLNKANLSEANLEGANLYDVFLGETILDKAIMPDGRKYEEWVKDKNHSEVSIESIGDIVVETLEEE